MMTEYRRFAKAFGEWVEAQPRGLTERLFQHHSERLDRAETAASRIELIDMEIEAMREKRLGETVNNG